MRYGLKYVSVDVNRTWEHVRLELGSELSNLRKIVGPCCTMGVTKARPSKRNSYQVSLNANDVVNVVHSILEKLNFTRSNVTTFGIDLMFSEGVGGKVWARFTSEKAMEVPFLTTTLESMNAVAPNYVIDDANNDDEIEIEPGCGVFYYKNCAVQVEEALDSGEVDCVALQSSNRDCAIGSSMQMPNIDAVKQHVLNTFDT